MIIAVERMVILTYSIELKQFIDGLSELIKRIKEYGLGEHAEEILGEIMASKNPNQVITSLLQSYIFNGLKYADGNVTIALKALTLLNLILSLHYLILVHLRLY